MTEPNLDMVNLEADLAAASAAMDDFARGAAKRAADDVGASFERAGERIAHALGRAAADGETAFKQMARVILEELARLAFDRIFTASAEKAPFFGAKAQGGSVIAGGAYLVGERGPEIFVPREAGEIAASAAGAVSVHFHLGAGADVNAVARNQGQIAAAIARAVAYGRRNL